MAQSNSTTNIKVPGLITGLSLILMALAAGFAYGFVYEAIYVPMDAESSSQLLQDNFELYKYGIFSWILIIILDIFVSIGIYVIYRETQKRLAALASILRIIYTLFLGFAVFQLAKPLINHDEINNSLFFFENFEKVFSYGLIIFGIHLLIFSLACFKSKFTPKFLAVLLCVGGISYIFIESSKLFLPHLSAVTSTIESVLIAPMALSELAFAVWLIIKSARLPYKDQV